MRPMAPRAIATGSDDARSRRDLRIHAAILDTGRTSRLARAKNPSTPRVRGYVKRESPVVSALSEKYGDRGLIVLGINVSWDKEHLARVFMNVYKVTYLVGRDASGATIPLYDIEATPTSLFIDKAGRLVEQAVLADADPPPKDLSAIRAI